MDRKYLIVVLVFFIVSFVALQGCSQDAVGSREVQPFDGGGEIRSSYCADHFERIDSDEMEMCGEGSIGDSPILDAYGCGVSQNYPSDDSCPNEMHMNNVYGFASGNTPGYRCYVPQEIGSEEPPEGCPIELADVECADEFVFDETSNLSWKGPVATWGCSFRCKSEPDPYDDNENWPCIRNGYVPIGGGGGSTCCAYWEEERVYRGI